MTEYDLACDALERDDWHQVWPLGTSIGKGPLDVSWPSRLSYIKSVEYFAGAGRWEKFRKIDTVQTDLERRFGFIQEHAIDLVREVLEQPRDQNDSVTLSTGARLSPVPPGTEFTKFTVRAEYFIVFGAQDWAPLDRAAAADLAEHDLTATSGVQVAGIDDVTAAGMPAVVARGSKPGEDSALAERRAVVVYAPQQPVHGRLLLHTDFADTAARIDKVLADLLSGLRIEEEQPSGVEA